VQVVYIIIVTIIGEQVIWFEH